MANIVQHLDEFGWDAARLCPQCGLYFVGFRRQKSYSQKCNEAAKRGRPKRQEYQARLMFERNYSESHNGRKPSDDVIG
jgi:uncharacterized C2H2 Zn-finger protein